MTWQHPTSPPAKKLNAMPSVRKTRAAVLWYNKYALLVDFLELGDAATADRCCGTLKPGTHYPHVT
jgi:hypothetical protein